MVYHGNTIPPQTMIAKARYWNVILSLFFYKECVLSKGVARIKLLGGVMTMTMKYIYIHEINELIESQMH